MDPQVFIDIQLSQLGGHIKDYKSRGWRLVNVNASSVQKQVELLYTFSSGEELESLRVLIDSGQKVPAASPTYPNAFIFENEARDLYGVEFTGGIIDFGGKFYGPSVPSPMNPSSEEAQEYLAAAPAQQSAAPSGEEVTHG